MATPCNSFSAGPENVVPLANFNDENQQCLPGEAKGSSELYLVMFVG